MRAPPSLLLLLALVGCGSADAAESGANSKGPSPSSTAAAAPVSSAPLQGTVGGNPFTGKVALAHYSPKSNVAEVFIFDSDRTCADYFDSRDGWRVQVVVRWQAEVAGSVGRLAELGGEPIGTSSNDIISAIFVRTTGSSTHIDHGREGRVEVIAAQPAKGSRGQIRVRASSEDGHQVEGAMPVEICTIFTDR